MISPDRRFPPALLVRILLVTTIASTAAAALAAPAPAPVQVPVPVPDRGGLALQPVPAATYRFRDDVGERARANLEHWLLRAPQANPGMLEMFRVRDRQPVPRLVPWAGEFIGKYLFSAIQALPMTDDPRLARQVAATMAAFQETQAEDGYLGPFPRSRRLLGEWDLWGHYHALQALLRWHAHSGDAAALETARRAGDLVCRTYLDGNRRVLEAGDPEMNMAILTGMAMLYRATGEERHLRMVREVEKDWETAGDYLRAGLDGREFYQSPRPRWESLHDLQGLVELWRITGDVKYRNAFVHHWRSLLRWDRRNTGGFSSGEQATGNPYADTAIETCCTVAWMALTVDYLKLTGDPLAADELELSTFNGGLGAQHPSGRWWTYNTPMNGVREASAHTIVFQSRAGTPELNCCSVNAPRILGVLTDWAVLQAPDGLALQWLAPFETRARLPDGHEVGLSVSGGYPVQDSIRITVQPATDGTLFTLKVRIPAWAQAARATLDAPGGPERWEPRAGTYLEVRRPWKAGDTLELRLNPAVRAVPGALDTAGQVSLYRGPLLLAWDPRFNGYDEPDLPAVDPATLANASVDPGAPSRKEPDPFRPAPWLTVRIPTGSGRPLDLVDFATAGSTGTRYRSWLPAQPPLPPPTVTQFPPDDTAVRPGRVRLQWRAPRLSSPARASLGAITHRVEVSPDPGFGTIPISLEAGTTNRVWLELPGPALAGHPAGAPLYWRVLTRAGNRITTPDGPAARFRLDPQAPESPEPPELRLGPGGELARNPLRTGGGESWGTWGPPPAVVPGSPVVAGPEGTSLNGRDQMLRFEFSAWPEEGFTVSVRARFDALPQGRIGQLFSGWTASQDDPLRLVVDQGKLHARIEAGAGHSTPGFTLQTGRWYRITAVRNPEALVLFVDGQETGRVAVPEPRPTQSQACALGGNPRFGGPEFLAVTVSEFAFWARPLERSELPR